MMRASLYGVLLGGVVVASTGWHAVVAYAAVTGSWVGWDHRRRMR